MVSGLLPVISGLLIWLGFAPVDLWFAPFFGIALLFRSLLEKTRLEGWLTAFVCGLSFFLPLLHWSSVYVGAVPWLVLAVGESLLFSLIGLFRWQKRWESALSFAMFFTFIELLRMKLPFGGFGWGRIGFTQVDPLTNLYPLIGVTGISLLIALFSLLAVSIRGTVAIAFLLILSVVVISPTDKKENQQRTLHITAIQGGVDTLGLDFNSRALRVLERHIQTTALIPNTDLYIWPENASDVDPLKNEKARALISKLLKEIKAPLVVGAVEETPVGPLNSSLMYDANGALVSRYVKQDLAPFGEFMPIRSFSEFVSPFAKEVNDFQPGDGWVKHVIKDSPFQSLICFEILDDDHAKQGARGSSFMLAQTNNATFGKSAEAAQQFQITRARAAESGRDFAVVSTTGFTAHIDSLGSIIKTAPQFEPYALTMNVELVRPEKITVAQAMSSGSWMVFLAFFFTLCRVRLRR